MRRPAIAACLVLPWTAGCSRPDGATHAPGIATATATATTTTTTIATTSAPALPLTPPTPPHREDAGGASCVLLRGPIELSLRGAVALAAHGDTIDVVLNDNGRPNATTLPAGAVPLTPSPGPELATGPIAAGLAVPCALAGAQTFCPDRTGAVHRAGLNAEGSGLFASCRSGARVAAATLARTHVALAYLASRETSEGWVSEAWLALDDAAPVRLSEDGSGATAVALQVRGPSLLALLVDSRAALTAMHARTIGYDGALHIGEDAVVFVGGPGNRRTTPAIAVGPTGLAWGLLPIGEDVRDFGLAIVKLDAPPRVDEPVVWSMYLNGLDPAPVAAATANEHRGSGRVEGPRGDGGGEDPSVDRARVRPAGPEPGAVRNLEVGTLEENGSFAPRDIVTSAAMISDVAMVADAHGTLWLAWADASGSWLERLACR